jgi:hypothetical protein
MELMVPDLDQIKQGEQGYGTGRTASEGEVTRFNRSRQQRDLQPVAIRHQVSLARNPSVSNALRISANELIAAAGEQPSASALET